MKKLTFASESDALDAAETSLRNVKNTEHKLKGMAKLVAAGMFMLATSYTSLEFNEDISDASISKNPDATYSASELDKRHDHQWEMLGDFTLTAGFGIAALGFGVWGANSFERASKHKHGEIQYSKKYIDRYARENGFLNYTNEV